MTNYNEIIKDSLSCEYGYIINLDDNCLEFWLGYQKVPQECNRYGMELEFGYYPCELVLLFPLDDIPENVIEQMQQVR